MVHVKWTLAHLNIGHPNTFVPVCGKFLCVVSDDKILMIKFLPCDITDNMNDRPNFN